MRHVICLVVSCLLLSPSLSLAQTFADRVPADAVLYIGWKGGDTAVTGYEGSHLQSVLREANFAPLVNEVFPQVCELIAKDEPDVAEGLRAALAIAGPLWRHPSAMFLQTPLAKEDPMRGGLICQAGADAKELAKQISSAIEKGGDDAKKHLRVIEQGELVIVQLGTAPAGAPGAMLAADPGFLSAMKQTLPDPLVAGYVNVGGLLSIMDMAVAEEGEDNLKKWLRARETMGVNDLRCLAFAGKFEGKDWATARFVDAPAPRKGLVSLFEGRPIEQEVLKMIPSTAGSVIVGRFDFAALFREIRNIVAAVDEEGVAQLDQGLGAAQMTIGAHPVTDILEPMGDTWILYSDESVAGNKTEDLVLVNKLDDGARAKRGLEAMWVAGTNIVNGRFADAPFSLKQDTIQDLRVSSVQLTQYTPSWTIQGDRLVMGLTPDVVVTAAKLPPPEKGFDQNEKFAALSKRLSGGAAVTSFAFADLPVTAPVMYEHYEEALAMARAMAQQHGVALPEKILPPLATIQAHVAPSAEVCWRDAAGFHARSISPFPGSDLLSNAPGSTMQVGSGALGLAILLPALARARETAHRVKCASNQRQIAMAILLYSNDNGGQYPPDLGTLVRTQDIKPEVFTCPSSNDSLPANWKQLTPQELADWVNSSSSYVFLGQGLNNAIGGDRMILHDKPENHGHDGTNMTFGDGHVEFLRMPEAQQLIDDPTHTKKP